MHAYLIKLEGKVILAKNLLEVAEYCWDYLMVPVQTRQSLCRVYKRVGLSDCYKEELSLVQLRELIENDLQCKGYFS